MKTLSMWYNVNFYKLAKISLPTMLRKPGLIAFIEALIEPMVGLHDKFIAYKKQKVYELAHNWQVCYMRRALNDRFDPQQRRIYIGNGVLYKTVYAYTEVEQQELFAHTENKADTIWLRTEVETGDTGADFIVYVPPGLIPDQTLELRALIDFYRLGSKRYLIIEINE